MFQGLNYLCHITLGTTVKLNIQTSQNSKIPIKLKTIPIEAYLESFFLFCSIENTIPSTATGGPVNLKESGILSKPNIKLTMPKTSFFGTYFHPI